MRVRKFLVFSAFYLKLFHPTLSWDTCHLPVSLPSSPSPKVAVERFIESSEAVGHKSVGAPASKHFLKVQGDHCEGCAVTPAC